MQTEVESVLSGLKADIQREILNHRGEGAGRVNSFVVDLRRHGERYAGKFKNMLAAGKADPASIEAAGTKAQAMITEAIGAAEKAGHVDFA